MHDQIAERWETQNEAGRRFFGRGDLARAEQAFTAAIREAEQLGAGDLRLATSLANLAQLKLRQRAHDDAERLFRRSLQIREAALGQDHASLVQTLNGLAAVCYARGDIEGAEPLFHRALAITERRLGPQHPDIVTSLNSLARIAFKRRDYAAAGPLLERLLMLKESTLGPDHPEAAPILTSLMKVRAAEGALDEAERLARRVVSIRESEQPPNEVAQASSIEALADVLSRLGKRDEERAARQRAAVLRSQPSAESGALDIRHGADDIFSSTPIPEHRPRPSNPGPRAPSAGSAGLILPEDLGTERVGIPDNAPAPRASPIKAMPMISMEAPTEAVSRRKTPTAAPPPLPESPRPEETNIAMEAGAEIVPLPALPPRATSPPRAAPPPPPPPPVVRPPAPVRHHAPEPRPPRIRPSRRPRRESTSVRSPRRGGRKVLIAVAVLITAGAAAAAMGRGGVIESRGATGEPTREFVPPRRRAPRAARVTEPSVDSIAAAVRDSVALLIGQPPVTQPASEPSQTPAQGGRDVTPYAPNEPDDPSLPPVDMRMVTRDVGTAAEMGAAHARARIDSATRKDVRPTFSAKPSGSTRP
ncbi:MAG: tetratricopeptide repeat protein [Gemmatimonadaceae bacterium]